MPRLTSRLPSYRRHKASGNAVVSLGGHDYYLGPWKSADSKREYDRLTGEWLASGGVVTTDPTQDLTLVEFLAAFKRHAKEYYVDPTGRPSGEQADYKTLCKRLGKLYGLTLVKDFGPLAFKAFRQTLVDRKLSLTSVNQAMNRLRHIIKWGVENELVRTDVFQALKCVAGLRFGKSAAKETEPIRPVPDAFVEALLPHVPKQIAAMIDLQRFTGMRSGEVVLLRGCDLNIAGKVWIYTPARHKTMYRGHVRTIYLGPKAQDVLRPWLRADLAAYLFCPAEVEQARLEARRAARTTPLSCGNRTGTNKVNKPRKRPGDHYDANSYGKAIRKAQIRLNESLTKLGEKELPLWHPHQLRHNAATFFRREHGLEVARVLLGHKHAAITEVYAEADRERAVEVMGKIG